MVRTMRNLALRMGYVVLLFLGIACAVGSAAAQSSPGIGTAPTGTGAIATSAATAAAVPPLVRFSGVAKELDGAALSGTVGVTFAIYKEQQGGAALWLETQNVQPDSSGQYSVMLGATKAEGLPTYLFAAGEGRWLGVQISGQAEQPRVLLLSVPYAMKAADADTVGGLPASAFLLAAPVGAAASATSSGQTQSAVTGPTADATPTGSGTTGFLPLWTTASNLGNSVLFQNSSGFIGINNPTPAVQLDIGGSIYVRGGFTVPQGADATPSSGHASHSINLIASAYNTSKGAAEGEEFQFQTAPVGNDTATPSGLLTLGFASGTNPVTLTGFSIASNGVVTFAPGQTFPAATITGSESVDGSVTASSTTASALVGSTSSNASNGVQGSVTAISGNAAGVFGTTASPNGVGVEGTSTSTTSSTIGGVGVYGFSENPAGSGVEGVSGNVGVLGTGGSVGSKTGTGVVGSGNGIGVSGTATGNSLYTGQIGVYGTTSGPSSYGVYGNATAGAFGTGVYGTGTTGVYGTGVVGVEGVASGTGSLAGFFAGTLEVTGNTNDVMAGDPGCGSGYAGIGFIPSGGFSGCTNYAILGGPAGGTYVNAGGTASIHFRSNNNELATIDNSGNVNIIGQNGGGNLSVSQNLSVSGKETSGNVFAQASASNSTGSQVNPGSCTQGTLTASDANCLVPNMTLTVTTSNPTALILVDIGGVTTDPCATANFYLLVDGKIVALSSISLNTNNSAFGYETGTVTITKLQSLAAGSHTFEVQSTTDLAGASCSTFTSATGISQGDGGMGSFRSLTVREF